MEYCTIMMLAIFVRAGINSISDKIQSVKTRKKKIKRRLISFFAVLETIMTRVITMYVFRSKFRQKQISFAFDKIRNLIVLR